MLAILSPLSCACKDSEKTVFWFYFDFFNKNNPLCLTLVGARGNFVHPLVAVG